MATTVYFEETIIDQDGDIKMDIEIGRSSFYEEDSIYIRVGGETVIMNRETARQFVDAVVSVGVYHGFTK